MIIFMVTSAYLLLELVIALSAQGEPTGVVAPYTGAQVVFPIWYAEPEFLDAIQFAMVAYPVAAIVHGIGMLTYLAAGRPRLEDPPRLPAESVSPPANLSPDRAVMAAPEMVEDVCVLSADRRIRHISPATARLFGLTPRDMLRRSLEGFILPDDLPKLDALVAAAYAEQPHAFATTVGASLPDGATALMDITCAAGGDILMGSPGATIFTFRLTSDRSTLDDQLAALWY